MVPLSLQRIVLLALPLPLLIQLPARGEVPLPATGIVNEDDREERFYNFDAGRQAGGGFIDPSSFIRKLQSRRNLRYATDPTRSLDAALEAFDENLHGSSPPEGEGETAAGQIINPFPGLGSNRIQLPANLFMELSPNQPTSQPTGTKTIEIE